jgi:exosortase/archaeosortase family protein
VLRVILGWSLALLLLALLPQIEAWAIGATVANLGLALQVCGIHGHVSGNVLSGGQATVEIVGECTSLLPTVLLVVAIASYPASAAWKLLGVLGGTIALWGYNLLRVLVLLAVLGWRPQWFEFIHVYLWQTVTFVTVLGFFLLWLHLQESRSEAR